jgi:glycerol-3-phosphate cytidylyltransferase
MNTVYTAGVFDLFHAGHLSVLERSKALAGEGGKLVVGIVSDLGAAAYKPRAPLIGEQERLRIVSALECVDAAFLQPGWDPSPVLYALAALGVRPKAMTHGDDWTELREGMDTLRRLGVEFVTFPLLRVNGSPMSTTRIRESASEEQSYAHVGGRRPGRIPMGSEGVL